MTIPGDNTAADVAEYARSRNATEIVVGKSLRPRWQEALFGSIVHDLIRHSGSIDLYIVTGAGEASEVPRGPQYAGGLGQSGHPYLASAAAVAVAGGLCALLKHHLALPNLSMLFLMAVLYSATVWGLWPAVFAAVSSLLVYDFFFVEPVLTFTVANPQDVLALVMYLAVAVLTSRLTARIRDQAEASRRREAQTAALFALTKRVAAAGNLHDVCTAVAREVAQSLQARVAVLLPQEGQLVVQAIEPAEVAMTEAERAAAAWALEHGRPAGQGSDTLPGIGWYCLPLCSADARLGVLATQLATAGRPLSPSQRRLLEACADLAAAAIDRAGK